MAELPPVPCMRAEQQIGIALRIGRRAFDAHLRPVGVEFLGEHGGDAGVGALAHLDMLGDDGHAVIGADAQKGIGREAGSPRRRGRRTGDGAPRVRPIRSRW